MGNSVPPRCEHFRGDGIFLPSQNISMVACLDIFSVVNVSDVNGGHLHGDIAEHGAVPSEQGNMRHKIAVLAENTVAAALSVGIAYAYPCRHGVAFRRKALHVA